jgi:hypothetical protein
VAFQRRYFTTQAALQRALDGFMQFYDTEGPHQGFASAGVPRPLCSGFTTTLLGRQKCQHRSESGQPSLFRLVRSEVPALERQDLQRDSHESGRPA